MGSSRNMAHPILGGEFLLCTLSECGRNGIFIKEYRFDRKRADRAAV
jgi:hypothetical protein